MNYFSRSVMTPIDLSSWFKSKSLSSLSKVQQCWSWLQESVLGFQQLLWIFWALNSCAMLRLYFFLFRQAQTLSIRSTRLFIHTGLRLMTDSDFRSVLTSRLSNYSASRHLAAGLQTTRLIFQFQLSGYVHLNAQLASGLCARTPTKYGSTTRLQMFSTPEVITQEMPSFFISQKSLWPRIDMLGRSPHPRGLAMMSKLSADFRQILPDRFTMGYSFCKIFLGFRLGYFARIQLSLLWLASLCTRYTGSSLYSLTLALSFSSAIQRRHC